MLKEKIIETLKMVPESVKMSVWLDADQPITNDWCGTSGCFAGHIILAADDKGFVNTFLGSKNFRVLFSKEELVVLDKWIQKEKFHLNAYNSTNLLYIPAYARYLWAKEYGDEAAEKLAFYSKDWPFDTDPYYREDMFDDLTADDLIEYLEAMD